MFSSSETTHPIIQTTVAVTNGRTLQIPDHCYSLQGDRWVALTSAYIEEAADDKDKIPVSTINLIDLEKNEMIERFYKMPDHLIQGIVPVSKDCLVIHKLDFMNSTNLYDNGDFQLLQIIDAKTNNVTELDLGDDIKHMFSMPDGKLITIHVARYPNDKCFSIKVWDMSNPHKPACNNTYDFQHKYEDNGVFRQYKDKLYCNFWNKLFVCDLQKTLSRQPKELRIEGLSEKHGYTNFIFQPNLKLLIFGYGDGDVGFYDAESHKQLNTVKFMSGTDNTNFGFRVLNSGCHLICWNANDKTSKIYLWDLIKKQHVETIMLTYPDAEKRHINFITNVAGNTIAIDSSEKDRTYTNSKRHLSTLDITCFQTLKDFYALQSHDKPASLSQAPGMTLFHKEKSNEIAPNESKLAGLKI